MRKHARIQFILLMVTVLALSARAAGADDLRQGFEAPPESAKPRTWWHWVDGNVTKSGITGDLEAMKRAGLGGCYLFSIGGFFPQGPAKFGEPGWFDLLSHTVKEAERLGLTFGVHNCDGWSESGGPWITPETSMKEITWSSLDVEGSQRLETKLPQPATKENFYRDIAVIAYPIPAGSRLNGPDTEVRGSLEQKELLALTDGQPGTKAAFPASPSGHRIEFILPEAKIVRSITLDHLSAYTGDEDLPLLIEESMDGKSWKTAGTGTLAWDTSNGEKPVIIALNEERTKYLRFSFTNTWDVEIGEVELSEAAKLHFAGAKSALLRARGHGGESRHLANYPGPDRHRHIPEENIIQHDKVVVLTTTAEGDFKWSVPAGRWRILRIGYTSNGRQNKPATTAGRGLECDKLDPKVVRFHLEQYVGRLAKLFGPATGKTFKVVETDSWECDIQNWTHGFEKRFESHTGYDLLSWMPLFLEGWVMDDADTSERVLWDWRRFLADQFAENYFAEVSKFLKARKLDYVSEGSGRQMYLYDAIGYQQFGDIPMGEFWLNTGTGQGVRVDNKVASSVAHTLGRKFVASESYTASARFANWQNHPYTLKQLGDRAYCAGVNQFVFHTFAHQPYETTGPGFTMAIWGLNCNRANTWWEPGRAWMKYLTRCNYLLQEGHFAADVLCFLGEDVPNRIGWRDELQPALPKGYDFDACDTQSLLEAKVRDGKIVLSSGMEYRVLLLPNRATMRPTLLKKIAALAEEGAVVLGVRPAQSPSYSDRKKADRQVMELAARVWGTDSTNKVTERAFGKGKIFSGLTFPELFTRLNLAPDFDYSTASPDAEVLYIHRRIDGGDYYFIANQNPRYETVTARFRVTDRQPEIWDPVTARVTRPAVFRSIRTGTELSLKLDPFGSVFVVFRDKAPKRHILSVSPSGVDVEFTGDKAFFTRAWGSGAPSIVFNDGARRKLPESSVLQPITVSGSWKVSFPPKLGAPQTVVFDRLVSWPERPEEGVKYFSGTATYSKEVDVPAERLGKNRELWLDLGNVQVIAQVEVNGKDLGILWKPPFRVDATGALKPGRNHLVIKVTNLWPNRMIGDENRPDSMKWVKKRDALPAEWPDWLLKEQPRPDGRITFCTRKPYKKGDKLLESGLIGPVRLVSAQRLGF